MPDAEKRIWGREAFRVFLCHKAEAKKQASELKAQLRQFGVSSFVAHKDIHPTKEWQTEIENALYSMDALVAMLSEGFHESLWTDQEAAVPLGGVPVILVRLGKDPAGLLKVPVTQCPWDRVDREPVAIHQARLCAL
jgi:hypothetical protein